MTFDLTAFQNLTIVPDFVFFEIVFRSDAVLSLGRAFDGVERPARDELLELLEYDDPDSDALESDDSTKTNM